LSASLSDASQKRETPTPQAGIPLSLTHTTTSLHLSGKRVSIRQWSRSRRPTLFLFLDVGLPLLYQRAHLFKGESQARRRLRSLDLDQRHFALPAIEAHRFLLQARPI